jgi:hypothetical protein
MHMCLCEANKDKPATYWTEDVHYVADGTKFTKGGDGVASRAGLDPRSRKRKSSDGPRQCRRTPLP